MSEERQEPEPEATAPPAQPPMLDYRGMPQRRYEVPSKALSFNTGFLWACGIVLGGGAVAFATRTVEIFLHAGICVAIGLVFGVVHAATSGSAKFLGGFFAGLVLLFGVGMLALWALCGGMGL